MVGTKPTGPQGITQSCVVDAFIVEATSATRDGLSKTDPKKPSMKNRSYSILFDLLLLCECFLSCKNIEILIRKLPAQKVK